MDHLKTGSLVLILAFMTFSLAAASPKNVPYRHLDPLSTNVDPENFDDFDDNEFDVPKQNYKQPYNYKFDEDFFSEQSKSTLERLSNEKAKEIEREIAKRTLEKQRKLQKFIAEMQREQKKHFEELERRERKQMEEFEKAYKKHLKELEKERRGGFFRHK